MNATYLKSVTGALAQDVLYSTKYLQSKIFANWVAFAKIFVQIFTLPKRSMQLARHPWKKFWWNFAYLRKFCFVKISHYMVGFILHNHASISVPYGVRLTKERRGWELVQLIFRLATYNILAVVIYGLAWCGHAPICCLAPFWVTNLWWSLSYLMQYIDWGGHSILGSFLHGNVCIKDN